jgi:hypothetical protein
MLLLNPDLLISVTFSTPTGDVTQNRIVGVNGDISTVTARQHSLLFRKLSPTSSPPEKRSPFGLSRQSQSLFHHLNQWPHFSPRCVVHACSDVVLFRFQNKKRHQ